MHMPRPTSSSDGGLRQRLTPQRGRGLRLLLACVLALSLVPLQRPSIAYAASFVVTKTIDTADGACDGDCSLREAIIAANNTPGPDTITFAVNGVFVISLNPGSDENASASGDFDILSDITIIGNGPTNTIIDGQNLDRVFDIDPFSDCNGGTICTVALSGMTIRNGRAVDAIGSVGGAIYTGSRSSVTITNSVIESSSSEAASGGGIEARGALSLTNVAVRDNVAGANGGGVRSIGNLTISNSTFSNNRAEFGGGLSLLQDATRTVNITNSTFSDNRTVSTAGGAADNGGAIYAETDATITITRSTFSANTAVDGGGGLFLQDSLTSGMGTFNLTNNTISGNRADGAGGGIYIASGIATITNVTITQNHSDNNDSGSEGGGGLRVAGGNVTVNNTIVAENYRGSGTTTNDNVNGAIVGSNNLTSGTPLLGPLADNGGSTLTHALLVGSPAIDTGNNTTCPAIDQRGTSRPLDGDNVPGAVCDIGAYELLRDITPPDTIIDTNPPNPSNDSTPTFMFSGTDDVTPANQLAFECQIDSAAFSPCSSPATFGPLADGLHTFRVRAIDAAGNPDASPASYTWTIDTVGPSVELSSAAPNPTNTSPIPVSVTFSEGVSGFTAADITVSNATVANFAGSGLSYTFDLVPAGQGLVTADIAAGAAQDAAGNPNAAAQFSRTYDTIAPSVTVNQAAGQADPTGVAPINFTVVFDEAVTGFGDSAADVTIGGTAGATTATVSGSGTTYNVAITGMAGAGTVVVTIPAGAAQDLAGNPSAASTSADNSVDFDPVVPVVTGIVRAGASPTSAASVQFTVTFSKNVTGVDASDFVLTQNGVSGASVTGVTGGGTTWTVTVSTGTGDGTIRLDLIDDDSIVDVTANPLGGSGAGNGNFSAGQVYTVDRTAPTAGGLVTPPITGGSTSFSFTVVFSDNLAIDVGSLDGSDIRVDGPNGFSQLAALVSVSPATDGAPRTATYRITPPGGAWDASDAGSYTVRLEANQVFDTAGNAAPATSLGSFQVSPSYTTYLPLALRAGHPDLVVQRIVTGGNSIQVVIRNQGSAPATSAFWVDLYINPARPPAGVNETWETQGSQGLVWGITGATLPLDPGESLTLTIGDVYFQAGQSSYSETLPAGTPLYAQVDSANAQTSYGGVLESHELSGGAYNNILGPVLSASIVLPPTAAEPTWARAHGLPAR